MGAESKAEFAVIGTGLAGQTTVDVLHERGHSDVRHRPAQEFGLKGDGFVELLPEVDYGDHEYVLLATEEELSERLAPQFKVRGSTVIDFSERFRLTETPLVVPPVNGERLEADETLVANPNCTTAIMVTALAPLWREYGIERLGVTSFQSVSGSGREAVSILTRQATRHLRGEEIVPEKYPAQISFNVIPEVGGASPVEGVSGEEYKVRHESRKILEQPDLPVEATCARVGVFQGHALDVRIRTIEPVDRGQAERLLQADEAVNYWPMESPTPVEAVGIDDVLVGRLRVNRDDPRHVQLWVVGDNLRRGAATNAVEIAERLQDLRR